MFPAHGVNPRAAQVPQHQKHDAVLLGLVHVSALRLHRSFVRRVHAGDAHAGGQLAVLQEHDFAQALQAGRLLAVKAVGPHPRHGKHRQRAKHSDKQRDVGDIQQAVQVPSRRKRVDELDCGQHWVGDAGKVRQVNAVGTRVEATATATADTAQVSYV